MVRSIGLDRRWEQGRGCYLYDDNGDRYLDFLSGFGVFGVGRSHPTIRRALQDVLDGELADMVQMDTPLLAGLLAEALIERAPTWTGCTCATAAPRQSRRPSSSPGARPAGPGCCTATTPFTA